MNISELHALIGKTGTLTTLSERLNVRVVVKDVRAVFGRVDVLVLVEGAATRVVNPEAWVAFDRLVIDRYLPKVIDR